MNFNPEKRSKMSPYFRQSLRYLSPINSWRLARTRVMLKLAVSYYRINWTIQPNKSDIGPVLLSALKSNTKQPNTSVSRSCELRFSYRHAWKASVHHPYGELCTKMVPELSGLNRPNLSMPFSASRTWLQTRIPRRYYTPGGASIIATCQKYESTKTRHLAASDWHALPWWHVKERW